MAEELTYVIITPHSLHKSRTGGIISRLLSRTGLELVAARMFAPSKELIQEYAKLIVSPKDPQDPRVQELIREYLLKEVMPDPKTGRRRRVMVLILKGEDAVRRTRDVVGNFKLEGEAGAYHSGYLWGFGLRRGRKCPVFRAGGAMSAYVGGGRAEVKTLGKVLRYGRWCIEGGD